MKYVYAAILIPAEEGFMVEVPDLPGCITCGESISDALEMAQDAIEMWLWDAENKNEAIPKASDKSEIAKAAKSEEHLINLIVADTDRYRRENDTRAVKKTLSIPLWLNSKAEKANAPFSQILQQGLKAYLDSQNQSSSHVHKQ